MTNIGDVVHIENLERFDESEPLEEVLQCIQSIGLKEKLSSFLV